MHTHPHSLSRLRRTPPLRKLLCETTLLPSDLIFPVFVKANIVEKVPIERMPGHFQYPLSDLPNLARSLWQSRILGIMLFGIPAHKDAQGSVACRADSLIACAIHQIKSAAPDLQVITDLCFCAYTDHGHCGILSERKSVTLDHEKTAKYLAEQALIHAKAGADMVAPSAMVDGMVRAIRHSLDTAGYLDIPILSYAVKYASALYGPFREAAESAPSQGDRRSYQMQMGNGKEALAEAGLDIQEGADMLMVKPAGYYLDVLREIRNTYPHVPLAAYQVSGEFAMIKAAAMQGWLDEQSTILESLTAIKRAGARFIISYFAQDAVRWL